MADSVGYYPIQWDVDSLDWKDYGADSNRGYGSELSSSGATEALF